MTPAERKEIASAWCFRMAEGEMSPQDEDELDGWLRADAQNRAVFDRMSAIWFGAPQAAELPEMIAMRADALEAMRAANQRRWSPRRALHQLGMPFAAIAAAVLLFIGLALFTGPFGAVATIYQTGVGERRVVRLDDGSRLSLDAASKVEIAFTGPSRVVRLLAGRAKFDVAHDPRRPFSVTAGDRTVIATGTAFSVELVQRQMRVILYEGHVRVVAAPTVDGRSLTLAAPFDGGRRADDMLTPGKILVASLDRPVATIEAAEPQRSLSWEGGQLTFSDDPLAVAAERINRYSERPVIVEGAAASLPISGAFNAGDANGFVSSVSALYPLRVTRRGDAIILSPGS